MKLISFNQPRLGRKLSRYRALGAALLFLCALLFAFPGWVRIGTRGSAVSVGPPGDFAAAVYFPLRAFLSGICPYDRVAYLARFPGLDPLAPYLPATFLVHLPFGFLSAGSSSAIYTALSIGLALLLTYVTLVLSRVRPTAVTWLLVTSILVFSRPGRMNLRMGQVTLQIVLGAYLALACGKERPWASGFGLAMALVKPSFGVPLAMLMAIKGHFRAVSSGVLLAVAISVPVLAVLVQEAGGVLPLSRHLLATVVGLQEMVPENDPALSPYRVDAVALLSRFMGRALGWGSQGIVAAVVLSLAAWALHVGSRRGWGQSLGVTSGIICTAVLLSLYHQVYDLLFLTLPFVMLVYGRIPREFRRSRARWALLGLLTFLTLNYLAGTAVLNRLGFITETHGHVIVERQGWAVLVSSLNGIALLIVFLTYLAVTLRSGSVGTLLAERGGSTKRTRWYRSLSEG